MSRSARRQYEFDRAIELTPTGDPDRHRADLPASWTVHDGPLNGGVTMALAGNALSTRLGGLYAHPDPLCVSAFFLTAAEPGPAEVQTEVVRGSRSMSTGQATVLQVDGEGRRVERLRAIGTFADLDVAHAPVRTGVRPPYLPPPEDCFPRDSVALSPLNASQVMQRYELAIDPDTSGWLDGQPSGLGHMRAWFRMRDGQEPTALMLLQVVDALPPVAYDLGVSGWVPTLELTVHVRARPAPGWLRISTSSVNFAGGFLEEDAEIWDASDRLVAQARQLARVPAASQPPPGYDWVV